MGNGVNRQTLRTNVVQPYSVGFLADTDNKDYNAILLEEHQKIQTSTEHMFKGLDDVQKEIKDRTIALSALHLQTNKEMNRVWLEISGVKQQIGTGITIENIKDANGNTLEGILTGIRTDITAASGNTSMILGNIKSLESEFNGEILKITSTGDTTDPNNPYYSLTAIRGALLKSDGSNLLQVASELAGRDANITTATTLAQGVDGAYTAQWGVKTSVNGLQGGVGFTNANRRTTFTVDAAEFRVAQKNVTEGESPFSVINGTVYANHAIIQNGQITNAMIGDVIYSNGYIPSGNNDPNADGGAGWIMRKDGRCQVRDGNRIRFKWGQL